MISTALTLALAAATMQNDTTRSAREAFQTCLRQHMNQSVAARTAADEFERTLPQQCSAQEAAYRAVILQRERGGARLQAAAEATANEEVNDARSNFVERYRFALEPR